MCVCVCLGVGWGRICLHINGWKLYILCIWSCLITYITLFHVRAGNLVESMTADLAGEVTSAAGPVRLEDLQRILSAIQPSGTSLKILSIVWVLLSYMLLWTCTYMLLVYQVLHLTLMLVSGKLVHSCYWSTRFLFIFNLFIRGGVAGLGLGDILKPDLVLPLIENLPIEQLASHLPEVCTTEMICYPGFQINQTLQLNSWSLPNSRAYGLLVISLSFSKVLLCANN